MYTCTCTVCVNCVYFPVASDDKLPDDNQYDPNTVAQGDLGGNNQDDPLNRNYDTTQDNNQPIASQDQDPANEAAQDIHAPDSQEGEYMMCT